MYKVFVATKGQPTLREAEFGSREWVTAHSLLEEPFEDTDSVSTMLTNPKVPVEEAYIFTDSMEHAGEIAHSFIYDEPFFTLSGTDQESELLECFLKGNMERFEELLDELPYDYTLDFVENEDGREMILTRVNNNEKENNNEN